MKFVREGCLVPLLVVMLLASLGCSGADDAESTETGADVAEVDTETLAEVSSEISTPPDTVAGPPDELFERAWWDIDDEAGLLELLQVSPFFQARDWLVLDAAAWFDEIVHETPGEEPEDASYLGYHGVGNGAAFGFVGTW